MLFVTLPTGCPSIFFASTANTLEANKEAIISLQDITVHKKKQIQKNIFQDPVYQRLEKDLVLVSLMGDFKRDFCQLLKQYQAAFKIKTRQFISITPEVKAIRKVFKERLHTIEKDHLNKWLESNSYAPLSSRDESEHLVFSKSFFYQIVRSNKFKEELQSCWTNQSGQKRKKLKLILPKTIKRRKIEQFDISTLLKENLNAYIDQQYFCSEEAKLLKHSVSFYQNAKQLENRISILQTNAKINSIEHEFILENLEKIAEKVHFLCQHIFANIQVLCFAFRSNMARKWQEEKAYLIPNPNYSIDFSSYLSRVALHIWESFTSSQEDVLKLVKNQYHDQ